MTEPIEIEFEVACSPEHAFDTWANKTSMWWPPSHSVSSAPGLVTFEPRPDGRIYERTPERAEHDWGEVLAWEPPRRLAYLWHLGTDRSRATEVDISFTGHAAATTVTMAATVVTLFVALHPRVMVSTLGSANDLTVTNTSSASYTLKVMTVAAAVLFPVVLAYQAWTYHVFRRRVR